MDPLQQVTILARAIQTLEAVRDTFLTSEAKEQTFAGVCARESWGELRAMYDALLAEHRISPRVVSVGQHEFPEERRTVEMRKAQWEAGEPLRLEMTRKEPRP